MTHDQEQSIALADKIGIYIAENQEPRNQYTIADNAAAMCFLHHIAMLLRNLAEDTP